MTELGEWQRLESALVCLRDPLSRISLAASQLDDIAIGSAISRSIKDAIGEIDLRIEDALECLRPALGSQVGSPNGASEVGEALSELVQELRPVLSARGLEIALVLPEAQLEGDGSVVRRVVCRLLLGIGQWLHECAGRVVIEVRPEPHAVGIRVEAASVNGRPAAERCDVLAPLRGFALSESLSIEEQPGTDPAHFVATIWLCRRAAR